MRISAAILAMWPVFPLFIVLIDIPSGRPGQTITILAFLIPAGIRGGFYRYRLQKWA